MTETLAPNGDPWWKWGICPHPAPTNLCGKCEADKRAWVGESA